ncbi:alpha-ketoglutarate-dependent dioxygenase AlkB [Streptomyces spiramenti]|uniref:Alpha-ketoglutarate-dependent dioxygenase AlkB n=1 Tax=Streptomyces spiramenti TaxID=2720606 RepID=A0ABX1AHW9_9ACTN|nr:alpha-ketoglutarate-dependent dioxygenase AlkB [Streptomyces spiramenti]NJP65800.1 alpha-ketoglutarate-dependent dioxygenase AlkB [Streptomyces spiramenti]
MDGGHHDEELFPREPALVAPGAVHLPAHLDPASQAELLSACRGWALPPAGLRTVRTRGGVMSVRQVGLGLHWYPYAYARTAVDGDGAPVKPFPGWLGEWAHAAVLAAARAAADAAAPGPGGATASGAYDVALVNFYAEGARMGMHRDMEERSPAPVVSFSLGDACVFRFGNTEGRGRPWRDTELRSGDAFVFGGPARLAYHAVPRTLPGTGPGRLGLRGRVNVTVRVSGLDLANEPGAAPGGR